MQGNEPEINDDDQEIPPAPQLIIKRAKLNDGTAFETLTEDIETIGRNVELDSDGLEVVSNASTVDVPLPNAFEDTVEVERPMVPSTSIEEIMFRIKRETKTRNYSRRNFRERSIGSNDYVSDSDDDVIPSTSRVDLSENNDSNTLMDIVEGQRQFELSGATSEDDNVSDPHGGADDSTDEDLLWSGATGVSYDEEGNELNPPAVLLKERPKHKYSMLREVLNREIGVCYPRITPEANEPSFADKYSSSLHAVLRLEKLHNLYKHNACVNCTHFHPEGELLVSGSDESTIIIWDWARNILLHAITTEHKSNVYQTKFLNFNSSSQLNIVTCGRDGHVRLAQCSSAGGSWSRRRLAVHGKPANKLHVSPLEPHSVLSAGEDGFIMHSDLRCDIANKLFQLKERGMAVALYSLHGHPFDANYLLLAGRDKFVRLYDRRRTTESVSMYAPTAFTDEAHINNPTLRYSAIHLTCAVYNHDGTEILASYNDEDIYLFNAKNDVYIEGGSIRDRKGFTYRYTGHRNSATLKSVSFYGPQSEYIVSGSDCGNIYIWDKKTESIIQWLAADEHGMVNTVEVHPRLPILASGGLDKEVKVWGPYSDQDPTYEGLSNTIRNNTTAHWHSPLFNDFLPSFYRTWRTDHPMVVEHEELPYYREGAGVEANICATF